VLGRPWVPAFAGMTIIACGYHVSESDHEQKQQLAPRPARPRPGCWPSRPTAAWIDVSTRAAARGLSCTMNSRTASRSFSADARQMISMHAQDFFGCGRGSSRSVPQDCIHCTTSSCDMVGPPAWSSVSAALIWATCQALRLTYVSIASLARCEVLRLVSRARASNFSLPRASGEW
jgi:hypothetical protein